jgi:hypothetical protein
VHVDSEALMSYHPFASSRAATMLSTSGWRSYVGQVVNLRPIGNRPAASSSQDPRPTAFLCGLPLRGVGCHQLLTCGRLAISLLRSIALTSGLGRPCLCGPATRSPALPGTVSTAIRRSDFYRSTEFGSLPNSSASCEHTAKQPLLRHKLTIRYCSYPVNQRQLSVSAQS